MAANCERCNRTLKDTTNRFCYSCQGAYKAEMVRTGYLQPVPYGRTSGDEVDRRTLGKIHKTGGKRP